MMIAPSPTLQSWAMWLMAMTRQPAPTSVHPSARVARWIVTYSRTTVLAPILTPEGVPSLNFKSCGRPPRMEPWPIFTPGASSTRPSRSEEHTSELQSRLHLVCRLLLEKKKTNKQTTYTVMTHDDVTY